MTLLELQQTALLQLLPGSNTLPKGGHGQLDQLRLLLEHTLHQRLTRTE